MTAPETAPAKPPCSKACGRVSKVKGMCRLCYQFDYSRSVPVTAVSDYKICEMVTEAISRCTVLDSSDSKTVLLKATSRADAVLLRLAFPGLQRLAVE